MLNRLMHYLEGISWCREWKERTYGYSVVNFAPASNATDILTISGADGVTVNIREVTISGVSTNNSSLHLYAVKRSTVNLGGTDYTFTNSNFTQGASANDSADQIGAKAVIKAYATNPTTLGAGILTYSKANHFFPNVTTPNLVEEFLLDFNGEQCDPLVLRGAKESLAINLSGQTIPVGLTLTINLMWTEANN